MKTIAVYPGTFDPVTNGHIDLIKRGVKIFDKVIIAVAVNPTKKPLFSIEERVEMLKASVKSIKNVEIDVFDGLLVDYVQKVKGNVIIRGLRVVSDFEYEFQMALMNRKLASSIEIVYMMPNEIYTYVSSSIIKEVARYKGKIDEFIPQIVAKKLKEKFLKNYSLVKDDKP